MNIQQIRNATILVHYAGKKFLIDPFLGEKGSYPPFPNSVRQDEKNPLVSLPMAVEKLIEDVDAVIVTHLHLDHYDEAAKKILPKNMKMFVQNEGDASSVAGDGFLNVEILREDTVFEGIQLIKTNGQHGRGEIVKRMGKVCGVVLKHSSEKTLYVAGDTVWNGDVDQAIRTHQPEIIVVNAGDNQLLEGGSLVMGKEDVYEVVKAAPQAKIIASHMEAVNHWKLSREELKRFLEENGVSENVLVPEDGEEYSF
ncbi:MBL fold metallo-hydrolase [Falsibacillus pallidus]|uniref:MBL fold metallo-hydrolase n=1 Tax=Falsibacillus pallidus TaxID=493781 RepID=UPI003D97CF73